MDGTSLIVGNAVVDDRGSVSFVNDFDMTQIKRFYLVDNHSRGFVRAWHAHKKEHKWVTVVRGAAIVCAVKINDWSRPDPADKIRRETLYSGRPSILSIPPGYANGFMSLTDDARLLVFSDKWVEESLTDDIRFPWDHWNPWTVEPR